ncbi:hypothetical protein [Parvibacter caecicola]|uniref:hypothetical protein n=1 Tax=Parvibacter caecicola TaxID=747645 RepID=UPI0027321DFD|nr:hypothetical protein [Parvibacter caecicola]
MEKKPRTIDNVLTDSPGSEPPRVPVRAVAANVAKFLFVSVAGGLAYDLVKLLLGA